MLVNFRVINFLSLGQLNTLSLVKGKSRRHTNHIYESSLVNLLKFSAIYGANGAGKSNIIKAINFSKEIIAENTLGVNFKQSYCRTNKENKNLETSFEYEVLIDQRTYSYGFSILLSKGELKKEWLYEIKGNEEITIYTIDHDHKELNIDIQKLTGKTNIHSKLETYIDDFNGLKKHEEALFLYFLNNSKSQFPEDSEAYIFNKLFNWFDRKLEVITPNTPADRSLVYLDANDESIESFLRDFGTGITRIHKEDVDLEELYRTEEPKFVNFVKNDILEKIKVIRNSNSPKKEILEEKLSTFKAMMRTEHNLYSIKFDDEKDLSFKRIKFCHYMEDDFYTLGEESDGTVRLLELYDIIKNNEGKVFIVDELDRSLHPNLTFNFIKSYLKSENNSQLIVSTHEDRILDLSIMRRDEIWFIEKNDIGESKLYSLEEFKTRFDKDIMNAYLDGRYGSVPKFKFLNN